MGALLEALCRLQDIERELTRLRQKEESLKRLIRTHQRQVEKNEAKHKAHLEKIAECQMGIDRADLEVKSIEEAAGKHRQALNVAKSNKEYAAILTALNTEKADGTKLENRMLQLMGEKEQLEEGTKVFQEEHARLTARASKSETDLEAFLGENRREFERLERERAEAADGLPPQALTSFNRVASKHDGEALAEVIKVHTRRDDYVCCGCNMSIPLEHVNALRGRDDIQVCPSCGRILFLGNSEPARR